MLFKEIIALYTENRTKPINKNWRVNDDDDDDDDLVFSAV
jgi:hypothetical protein